jgi:hypothetical protein
MSRPRPVGASRTQTAPHLELMSSLSVTSFLSQFVDFAGSSMHTGRIGIFAVSHEFFLTLCNQPDLRDDSGLTY